MLPFMIMPGDAHEKEITVDDHSTFCKKLDATQTTQYAIHSTLLQHCRYTIHSFSTAADIIVPKWSDSDDSDESNQ